MAEKFAGLVVGRHVFYEHPHEKTRAAIVAEVEDAAEGKVTLLLILKSGMTINMRQVLPDPSVTGETLENGPSEGFVHGRWRWMYDGQANDRRALSSEQMEAIVGRVIETLREATKTDAVPSEKKSE